MYMYMILYVAKKIMVNQGIAEKEEIIYKIVWKTTGVTNKCHKIFQYFASPSVAYVACRMICGTQLK